MTNCNNYKFPSTCNPADYGHKEFFMNTGEEVYYQKITGSNLPEDDVVIILRNGEYYKAILQENTINIEWYRCNERYANDEAMITQAIKTTAYLGATLRFDAREYIVNKQLEFQNLSCFKLLGDKQHTLIKSNTTERFSSYYLKFVNCKNFIIEGIQIDQNKKNLVVYKEQDWGPEDYPELLRDFNGGIYITGATNVEIKDCSFLDLYTRAVHIYACDGDIKITNNLFESGVQTQMYRMEHLTISQSRDANVIVENNVFKNAENHNPATGVVAIFAFDLGEKNLYLSITITLNIVEEIILENIDYTQLTFMTM